jgi:putative transcriptional regulator
MTIITAKIRKSDGQLVRVHPDGREEVLEERPMRPMTEEEIHVAAMADPDARPMTPEEMAKAKRVPRVRTLRRAL